MRGRHWPSLDERFKSGFSIDCESGCWLWNKSKNIKGYGTIFAHGRATRVHRFSYESFYGPVPKGLVLDHICRVRNCVNPTHLRLVTNKENILAGEGLAAKNARKTHCKHGHSLSGENVYMWHGFRSCRVCHNRVNENYRKKGELPSI